MPTGRRWGTALIAPGRGAGLLLPDKRVWKRSNPVLLAIAASVWICVAAKAGSPPNLADTILYQELAHNCRPVDLTTWNHPTKQVPKKYQVPLHALELCNSDKYPIFHVEFKLDPIWASNNSFFDRFYNAMFDANGRNPMALVDGSSQNVTMISRVPGKPEDACATWKPGYYCVSYEEYSPQTLAGVAVRAFETCLSVNGRLATEAIEWLRSKRDAPKQPEKDKGRPEDTATSDRQQPVAKRRRKG